MSNLTSNYEISVWGDYFDTASSSFKERRICVIGANDLYTQSRAMSPHFKRGVNGANELSFDMYYRYTDNITGEEVENPFIGFLSNETKIKLKHKDKWYDFIIKNIQEDSVNRVFRYQATDQHVNELSKNGYGLTLDLELQNNIGTVKELGGRIFDGTGWTVEADNIPQKMEEPLIEIPLVTDIVLEGVCKLMEYDANPPLRESGLSNLSIKAGSKIYVFYSVLQNGADRFQFIYSESPFSTVDRVIQDKNCQYYIDGVIYSEVDSQNAENFWVKYGFKWPEILGNVVNSAQISQNYKGNRYVFSQKTVYNSILDRYVKEYTRVEEDEEGKEKPVTWHEYTETVYQSPNLIQNLITNTDFKQTTGWTGQYYSEADGDGKPINGNTIKQNGVKIEAKTTPDILTELANGSYSPEKEYIPYLYSEFPGSSGVLINSGIYDNRKKIENFSSGQQFVLMWNLGQFDKEHSSNFLDTYRIVIGEREYSVEGNCYLKNSGLESVVDYMVFDGNIDAKCKGYFYVLKDKEKEDEEENRKYYGYAIASITEDYSLTKMQFQSKKIQIFIETDNDWTQQLNIYDLQLFPYIPNGKDRDEFEQGNSDIFFLTPESQAAETQIITEYYYFNPESLTNKTATTPEEMVIVKSLAKLEGLFPSYSEGAEKTVTLSVHQSNYFNAAQSLAETAQCWVDFEVAHDAIGNIGKKTVYFKNDIQNTNYAGFRYGVNLKGIQRNLNSKAIVSKLIVQDAINEYADNGFSSIARASSNETGENFIYDFSYYVRQKQLNYNQLWAVLYDLNQSNINNAYGYYFRLKQYNKLMQKLSTSLNSHTTALLKAKADLQVAEAGMIKSAEEHETAALDFEKLAGYSYAEVNANNIKTINNEELLKAFTKCATLKAAYQNYEKQKAAAQIEVNKYEELSEDYNADLSDLKEKKKALNDKFNTMFLRFIQEGTWSKQESFDDEEYYLEAQSVAFTSAQPEVTYTISVLSLDGVEGYENFSFDLADLTFIEDEEYFGYDEHGNPYREQVFLTEIDYYLDEPDKTSIKVQNFKNKFQDLFQRIAAEVQAVTYASGAWQSAADFVQSDTQSQASFLTNALNNAEAVLQNAGEQSVVIDNRGITVTDLSSPDQKLRIVAGAIMLGTLDKGGQEKWSVGMTARGIDAKSITTGRLNTGEVVIMNGDYPTFRWDSSGITAFDYLTNTTGDGTVVNTGFNFNKGVRFDRFGIYGYDLGYVPMPDGLTDEEKKEWYPTWPTTLEAVRENSLFALTWDGLFLKLGRGVYTEGIDANGTIFPLPNNKQIVHKSNTILGRTNGLIYNAWDDKGLPYFDTTKDTGYFTKIFAVGSGEGGNEELVIYDDGTLSANNIRLTGSIVWTELSSPQKTVYATREYVNDFNPIELAKPDDNKRYSTFPAELTDTGEDADNDGTPEFPFGYWHQQVNSVDAYYATTYNGGATWQGPFLISGRSIAETVIEYQVGAIGADPTKLEVENWNKAFPLFVSSEQCVYKRKYYIFDDGRKSTYEYEATYVAGPSPYLIEVSNDSITIPADENGNVAEGALGHLTDIQVTVREGSDDITEQFSFKWAVSNTDITLESDTGETNSITGMASGCDNGVISIEVYKDVEGDNDQYIGVKRVSVSKIKNGESAIGYYFTPSIDQINLSEANPPTQITFSVYKVEGAKRTRISSGYKIKIGEKEVGDSYTIPEAMGSTTFDLYIGEQKWDSETISVVRDGASVVRSYVESLSGTLFVEDSTEQVTLIARIFIGENEVDPLKGSGTAQEQQLVYTWHIVKYDDTKDTWDDNRWDEANGAKKIRIDVEDIQNNYIYFEATKASKQGE